jgi:alpha,alpha-trehalase
MLRSYRGALGLLIALLPASIHAQSAAEVLEPPQLLFKDLFVAVESGGIFADSKVFPDAQPRAAPDLILEQFRELRPDTPTSLKAFVAAHFILPLQADAAPSPPGEAPIAQHIDRLWDELTRTTTSVPRYSSLLALPSPYVVPGGRFREMYYWDSYFTMLGLKQSGRNDLVQGMVRNFAYLIDTFGHVPNGTRTYYISRSQPPFFFEMVALLSKNDAGAAFSRYLPQLRREYAFWMDGATQLHAGGARRRVVLMPDGSVLNRYWDDRDTPRDESFREDAEVARNSRRAPTELYRDIRAAAESGWDFGSRWLADGRTLATINTTEIVPVDLNSLLFGLESAIRSGCQHAGEIACAREFTLRAAARRKAINHYFWDARSGAYLDYHWTQRARVPRLSAASLYPLYVGAASPGQAAMLAKTAARDLLKAGGIATTTADTGQQWDSPNGWAPLQWIAISGLRNYGQDRLAESIACRWMQNVMQVYRGSGKLVEKYDVVTLGRSGGGGEYPTQDGFGWTNGVMRTLLALYPRDAELHSSAQCQ